ncbi:putative metalloprotease with PDZ domain [Lysobacter sp. HA18]
MVMAQSWPGDAEPVASGGWPALVQHLSIHDAHGHACAVVAKGSSGWDVAPTCRGALTLDYDVDYTPLQKSQWPAPRETAFRDARGVSIIGRSLFITRGPDAPSSVSFHLPPGWNVTTPWPVAKNNAFAPNSTADLVDNLFAFSERPLPRWSVNGFDVRVLSFGAWRDREAVVQTTVRAALERYTRMMPLSQPQSYLVVLLPQDDTGGESFRASFAMNTSMDAGADGTAELQRRVAHELFHYWNGWRLRGADYASTQWFQEGFTDYMATTTLRKAAIVSPQQFRAKFAAHVQNGARLQTPLATPGTYKGPPLYSGGALVALHFDALIRQSTSGRLTVDDAMSALWRNTDQGTRAYTWTDIRAALTEVAPDVGWDALYAQYVSGDSRFTDAQVSASGDVVDSTDP